MKKAVEEDPVVDAVKEMSASVTSLCEALNADCGSGDSDLRVELKRTNARIDKLGEDTNRKLDEVKSLILQEMNSHLFPCAGLFCLWN